MNYDGYTRYDEKVAADYDRDRMGEAHWQAEHAFVENYARTNALGRVLDLPAGTGRFLPLLESAQLVIGADISEAMLRVARANAVKFPKIASYYIRADALALPFADGTFDTVLCFRLLHLLPPELVAVILAELARVTRHRLLLQLYVAQPRRPVRFPALRRMAGWIKARLVAKRQPWSHIQSFRHTKEFLADCVQASGLELAKVHSLGQYEKSDVVVYELAKR